MSTPDVPPAAVEPVVPTEGSGSGGSLSAGQALLQSPAAQTAWRAARRTVDASATRLRSLADAVRKDQESNVHSALRSGNLSVLDFGGEGGDLNLASQLRQKEAAEARLRSDYDAGVVRDSRSRRTVCCRRCVRQMRHRFVNFTAAPAAWVYLIVLGLLSALAAFLVDGPVYVILEWRDKALSKVSTGAGFFIWVPWCVAFALISAFVVHRVPMADGSGIPQMKALLAGTSLRGFLTLRVAAAKTISLIAALGAGLTVGREGPFVAIASCIGANLWRLPYLSKVGAHESTRRQMLAAAIAAGVTAVWATPIGGVLFSIETTSTFFLTASYFQCFVTAVVTRFVFDIIVVLKQETSFSTTRFPGGGLSAEILAFVALGIVCGILGSLVVWTVNKVRIARKLLMTSTRRRYAIVVGVALTVSSLLYAAPYLRASDRATIQELFSDEASNPDGQQDLSLWQSPSLLLSLAFYFAVRFITTVLSISLPISCGLFVPLFCLGAAAGRFFGEVMHLMLPNASLSPAGVYAVIGAAALTSGATQTVSTAVIVMEITGQTSYLMPVLLGTLVAYSVSGIWTVSLYDMLLSLAGLPYLPRVYSSSTYDLSAADIMHSSSAGDMAFLSLSSTHEDALALLTGGSPSSSSGRSGGSSSSGAGSFVAAGATGASKAAAAGGSPSAAAGAAGSTRLIARRPSLFRSVLLGGRSSRSGGLAIASGRADGDVNVFTQSQTQIAVVDDESRMTLLGAVSRRQLEAFYRRKATELRAAGQAAAEAVAVESYQSSLAAVAERGRARGSEGDRDGLLAAGASSFAAADRAPLAPGRYGSAGGSADAASLAPAQASRVAQLATWLNRALTREGDVSVAPTTTTVDGDNAVAAPSRSSDGGSGGSGGNGAAGPISPSNYGTVSVGSPAGSSGLSYSALAGQPARVGTSAGMIIPTKGSSSAAAGSNGGGAAASLKQLGSRIRQWLLGDDPLSLSDFPEDFLRQRIEFAGLPPHLLHRPILAYSAATAAPHTPTGTASGGSIVGAELGGSGSGAGAGAAGGSDDSAEAFAIAPPPLVRSPHSDSPLSSSHGSTASLSSLGASGSGLVAGGRGASSAASAAAADAAPRSGRARESDCIVVDAAPFAVTESTPLPRIHYLFAICLFSELFVTAEGSLAGIILKDDLAQSKRLRNLKREGRGRGGGAGSAAAGGAAGGAGSDGEDGDPDADIGTDQEEGLLPRASSARMMMVGASHSMGMSMAMPMTMPNRHDDEHRVPREDAIGLAVAPAAAPSVSGGKAAGSSAEAARV